VGFEPTERGPKSPTLSWRYVQLGAAHLWRLTPDGFDGRHIEERAEMIAFSIVRAKIESYYADDHLERSEKSVERGAKSVGSGA